MTKCTYLRPYVKYAGPPQSYGTAFEHDSKLVERLGRPTDIAPVVIFLLSDDSKYIRGANIPVDGGIYQHILLDRVDY